MIELVTNGVLPNHGVIDRGFLGSDPAVLIRTARNGTQFSSTFRGTNGAVLTIDPGDGSDPEQITLLGLGTNVAWNHTMLRPATIRITGADLSVVDDVRIGTNFVTGARNFCLFESLEVLICSNNSLTNADFLGGCFVNQLYAHSNMMTNISGAFGTTSPIYFRVADNPISWVNPPVAWSLVSANYVNFRNSLASQADVDACIIAVEAAGMASGSFYVDGTNPAPSAASAAALVALAGRGCTVFTN